MGRAPPRRHWRSYGTETLPTGAEALDEPFAAFPSWFLRIECDRCGKVQMVNEVHMKRVPCRSVPSSTGCVTMWQRVPCDGC
jgi:ribosomal protein S27E